MLTMSPQSEGPRTPRATNLRGGRFDPLTAIAWHTAFWADDPLWSNPGNGNAVSSWRDGSGNGRTASQGSGTLQPKFYTARIGSGAAVVFDGVDDYLATGAFTALVGTYTVVAVFKFNTTTQFSNLVALNPTTTALPFLGLSWRTLAPAFGWYDQSEGPTVSPGTTAHLILAKGASASTSKSIALDGVAYTNGSTSFFNAPNNISLGDFGDGGATNGSVEVAFLGLYSGAFESDGNYSAFKTWVSSTYGITVA